VLTNVNFMFTDV